VSAPTTIPAGLRLTVVGDAMLDEYIFGEASRISPEAPVPVVHAVGERVSPGGAAHSARCAAGLEAVAELCTVVGEDASGRELARLLAEDGVAARLVSSASTQTIRKVRIFAGHHQVARVDYETITPLGPDDEQRLVDAIGETTGADAILVADYAKGAISEAVMERVRAVAKADSIPVVVDPKATDWSLYRGVTVLTPNLTELSRATGMPTATPEQVLEAGARISAEMSPAAVVVTRGAHGMSLFIDGRHVADDAAVTREVIDVTGAGDTVAACIALARAAGLEWPQTMRLANLAAGLAIRRAGTAVVSLGELQHEVAIAGHGG
jgi:D-beta-D-heptose 7-phosphate kinase/D-beta-D-heptose 1-phosphate adenosyltransferase